MIFVLILTPRAGLEPATLRLTAGCSAIELSRIIFFYLLAPHVRFLVSKDLTLHSLSAASGIFSCCLALSKFLGFFLPTVLNYSIHLCQNQVLYLIFYLK